MKSNKNLLNYRLIFISIFFLFIISFSYYFSFALRFEFQIPDSQWRVFLFTLPFMLIIRIPFAHYFGLSRGWWGYAGLTDLVDITKYNVLSSLAFTLFLVLTQYIPGFSRSILLLDWSANLIFLGGARFLRRFIKEATNHFHNNNGVCDRKHVLIVGAGGAGIMILREMKNNPRLNYHPIGFIDDNERKKEKKIDGIPVLGSQQDIFEIAKRNKIDEIIIAIPSATSPQLKKIVDNCTSIGIKVKTTPSVSSLIDGVVHLNQVREIAIEDLLGRKPISPDHSSILNEVQSKKILITGAGGSIGSELAWQLSQYGFKQLILLERGESELYDIELKLKKIVAKGKVIPIIGDVLDNYLINEVMEKYRPDLVYHAAAYKHVPMMEFNPLEGIRNNLLGTLNVARLAMKHGVEKFIFVSTDKAVRPSSVMGATKRAVELVLKTMGTSSTQFITVRFGNVLNSRGSVVPLFKKQIAEGGPITVTHPFIIRYFMSIPEACQLILQAGTFGKGGELFLLDMGEPVRIVDLAENLIRLVGLEPYRDIEIVFTGLRPGEKLYEELFNPWEGLSHTSHKKILKIDTGKLNSDSIALHIAELEENVKDHNTNGVMSSLKKIVPSFRENYQYHDGHLDENIKKGLELNIRMSGREFKGNIVDVEKEKSIKITLPSIDLDIKDVNGKLKATFLSSDKNQVIRFHTSIINCQNGSGPPLMTIKYPSCFETRDDLRMSPRYI